MAGTVIMLIAVTIMPLQDQIAVLASHGTTEPREHELSLRILRHLATSVRHQKYHDADIVTLHIEGPTRGG